jgi:hypothetical protein
MVQSRYKDAVGAGFDEESLTAADAKGVFAIRTESKGVHGNNRGTAYERHLHNKRRLMAYR